jgi:preprotein translocase subunit SecG
MLQSIVTWVWLFSGLLLVISVLLHSPKGDGMGGLAASGGSMFSSARSAEATLNRITWTLLATFLGLAVALSAGWLKGV